MGGKHGGKGLKRVGFNDALFATVGLGLFFLLYLRTTVLEKVLATAVLLVMLALTYLVVKGLVVFARTEEQLRCGICPGRPLLTLLFLFYLGLVLYDVPASLGYLSFFATSTLQLVGLDYDESIIAAALLTAVLVAVMYYREKVAAKMASLKTVYTSILIFSVPALGLGDGPAVSITGLMALLVFSLVGFSPILASLVDKGYYHDSESLREYLTGAMLGFTVATLAEITYLALGLPVFHLQLMPVMGRVLVAVNGVWAYVGFTWAFAKLLKNLARVSKALAVCIGRRNQNHAFGLGGIKNDGQGNDKVLSLLLAILIDIVVGTLLLLLHYPVETYLEFAGKIGGLAQYSTAILAFVWSTRGKEKAKLTSQVTYNTF